MAQQSRWRQQQQQSSEKDSSQGCSDNIVLLRRLWDGEEGVWWMGQQSRRRQQQQSSKTGVYKTATGWKRGCLADGQHSTTRQQRQRSSNKDPRWNQGGRHRWRTPFYCLATQLLSCAAVTIAHTLATGQGELGAVAIRCVYVRAILECVLCVLYSTRHVQPWYTMQAAPSAYSVY